MEYLGICFFLSCDTSLHMLGMIRNRLRQQLIEFVASTECFLFMSREIDFAQQKETSGKLGTSKSDLIPSKKKAENLE